MALVLRLRDEDTIRFKLEDGREVKVCVHIYSKNRTVAYIEAPKSISVDRIHGKKKELDDRARDISE